MFCSAAAYESHCHCEWPSNVNRETAANVLLPLCASDSSCNDSDWSHDENSPERKKYSASGTKDW